jgi:SAM-dependent methyltransferase
MVEQLYGKLAQYYDLIYGKKDYAKETRFLESLIKQNRVSGKDILEVGCGTGNHTVYLNKKYDVLGMDFSNDMLAVARKKLPDVRFIHGDMRKFNLHRKFDVVLCLFSVMHYNYSYNDLEKTLKNFYNHVNDDGLVIFDMGFNKERFQANRPVDIINADNRDGGNDTHITRVAKMSKEGDFGVLRMGYVLVRGNKFDFGLDEHKLRIFDSLKVKDLCEKIGFDVKIYSGYKHRSWNAKSKKYVIFACRKNNLKL